MARIPHAARGAALISMLAATGMTLFAWAEHDSPAPSPPTARRAVASGFRFPFAFEANQGQFASKAPYVSRGPGFVLEASAAGVRLTPEGQLGDASPFLLRFEGSPPEVEPSGEEPLAVRSNYLLGSDPSRWVTEVPSFRRVRYKAVYPGVDAVFYGNPRQLEYDFEVAPGGDPAIIRLRFEGVTRIETGKTGELLISTAGGAFRMESPLAYQTVGSERVEVEAGYKLLPGNRVGFRLPTYDSTRPLVIDPILLFSSYFGGGEHDEPGAIAVDPQGNHYLAGFTQSVNLPAAGAAYQAGNRGGRDVFVAKFNSSGTLLYSTYIGGGGSDSAEDIAIDASGNAYVCGSTSSTDFPTARPPTAPDNGDLQTTYGGGTSDGFLLKLSANGSSLLFSTYIGGNRADSGSAVAVNAAGDILAAGTTASLNFPVKDALQGAYGGGQTDVFLVQYAVAQARRVYSTYLGGSLDEFPFGAAFDAAGALFVGGYTRSNNFPRESAFQEDFGGGTDIFLSKLSPGGTSLLFSTYLGGAGSDVCFALALDPEGNPCLVGESSGGSFPTRNAVQSIRAGGIDAVVVKMDSTGSSLIFSTYLGGSGSDSARGVATGAEGDVYVTGGTSSSDFPAMGTLDVDPDGIDAFLSRFSPRGGLLAFSTYLIGDATEIASDVALDGSGNAYVTGLIDRPGLLTLNARQSEFGGSAVFRSQNRAGSWQASGHGIGNPVATALAVDPTNPMTIYVGVSGEGVSKSVDGGATWNPTGLTSGQIQSLLVDPTAPAVVYAGTSATIFKSVDGGTTWEEKADRLPAFAGFQALAIDPNNPANLYVGTAGHGIFKSTNAADSWRAINNGLDRGSEQQVFAVAVNPANSDRVYLATLGTVFASSNGGSSWQPTSLTSVEAVTSLAVDPQETNTIYAAAFSQQLGGSLVAKTTDAGVNWRAIPVDGTVVSLRIDPGNRNTLYAGTTDAGVLKSVDAGNNWPTANSGLGTRNVTALAVGGGANVYVGTSGEGDGFVVKVAPERIFYFPQVGDGVGGRIRFQTRLILVNTGGDTDVALEFFDASGNPLSVTLSGLGTGSQFQFPMARGTAFSAETPGQGPLRAGYARIRTNGLIGGTAVFRRTDAPSGLTLYEAGVPASFPSGNFSLLLDSLGNRDSGVAVVNAAPDLPDRSGEAELTLTLLDKDSNFVGEVVRPFPRGDYFAQFITEMFPEIAEQVGESQGTLSVTTDQPMAAVSLRQNEDPVRNFPQTVPTLTALPVIPTNSGHSIFYFPQVGDGPFLGSRFQTSLIFANTGFFPAAVTIDFFNSAGEPLELNLGEDLGTGSSFQVTILGGGFAFLQTSGGEQLQVGYARVATSSGAVGGVAVFSETDVRTGVLLYEAGVPASTPFQEFSLFADSTGIQDTGLALVNPDPDEGATVTLRLYDTGFHPVDEVELQIGPLQHRALLLYQLFPDAPGIFEFQGVMTAESDRPLAAVTLRSGNDLTRQFPGKVPTLTAFPITPEVAN